MRQQSWIEFGKPATTSQRRGWNSNKGHSLIEGTTLLFK